MRRHPSRSARRVAQRHRPGGVRKKGGKLEGQFFDRAWTATRSTLISTSPRMTRPTSRRGWSEHGCFLGSGSSMGQAGASRTFAAFKSARYPRASELRISAAVRPWGRRGVAAASAGSGCATRIGAGRARLRAPTWPWSRRCGWQSNERPKLLTRPTSNRRSRDTKNAASKAAGYHWPVSPVSIRWK